MKEDMKESPIIKVSFLFEKKEFGIGIICDKEIELMRPDELSYLFKKASDLVYEKFTIDECSLSFREKYIDSLDSKQKEYLNKIVREDFSGVLPPFVTVCLIVKETPNHNLWKPKTKKIKK